MQAVSKKLRTVNPFVDVEAAVGNDGSEDDLEEGELEDAFIDDVVNPDDEPCLNPLIFRRNPNEMEDALNSLLERMLSAAQWWKGQVNSVGLLEIDQAFVSLPSEDDFPIYRVACRIGTEEIIIASLLNSANEIHDLRAAFTRGSLRGSVYVECSMNPALIRLLQRTPGVVNTRRGLRYQILERSEYPRTLSMRNRKRDVVIGKWIRVSNGLYRGDVGLVVGLHSWGSTVLLVPRIPLLPTANVLKRKATRLRPSPRLFDPQNYPESSGFKILQNTDGSYTMGRLSLEHGLLVKEFDYHSTTSNIEDMPSATFFAFASCGHPAVIISSLPRPQEWSFQRDDAVTICSSNEQGLFQSVQTDYAEVATERGLRCVPWHDIIRNITVGCFVTIESGTFSGNSGWVIEITDRTASIVGSVENKDVKPAMIVRLNELKIATPPYHYTKPFDTTPTVFLPKSGPHAWCGTNVVVIHHKVHKGKPAVVKDVLLGQTTATTFQLELQLLSYDPAAPYPRIFVDSDDVVDAQTYKKLGSNLSNSASEQALRLPWRGLTSGAVTPMPTSASETPAWNPSSETPRWAPAASPEWSRPLSPIQEPSQPSSSSTSEIRQDAVADPQHVLLNPRLVGITLNVKVNGSGYSNKVVEAKIHGPAENVTIRHVKYKTSILLQPECVTPKHPSPTHDNGLLVIIKGDHCGKHARRVYHQHTGDVTVIKLAIVDRTEKSTDVLTEERLELTNDFLCTVKEATTDRERNDLLMQPLRAKYRKDRIA